MKNNKYIITEIAHPEYPFLHRIRALQDIGEAVKAGDFGGYVESYANLSFEAGDQAWIFNDAIACNMAYVDKGAVLKDHAAAKDNAYITQGAELTGYARAEDDAYIRAAVLSEHALASGNSMIMNDPERQTYPIIGGNTMVYGRVTGAVRAKGWAIVFSGEDLLNDTPDTLILDQDGRHILRNVERDQLRPRRARQREPEKEDDEYQR